MSHTTRSLRTDRSAVAALGFAFALALIAAPATSPGSQTPQLPTAVSPLVPDGRLLGQGELTWFGLSIYRGYLWSPAREWVANRPFALDLHYSRTLKGSAIAERSVEEIRSLGYGTDESLAAWGDEMRRIFPDVVAGDRLTGVYLPGHGARFFHNGKAIGDVADSAFAEAFFGIWLHPETSRPDLRRKLLGQ